MVDGAVSVMIVEDDPGFCELVTAVLARSGGYEVRAAEPTRWVEDVRDAAPDVVLLDLALGEVDAVARLPRHLEEHLGLFRRALAGEDVVAPSAALRRQAASRS